MEFHTHQDINDYVRITYLSSYEIIDPKETILQHIEDEKAFEKWVEEFVFEYLLDRQEAIRVALRNTIDYKKVIEYIKQEIQIYEQSKDVLLTQSDENTQHD